MGSVCCTKLALTLNDIERKRARNGSWVVWVVTEKKGRWLLTGHLQRPVMLSHTPLAPVGSGGFSQVEGQAMVKVLVSSMVGTLL